MFTITKFLYKSFVSAVSCDVIDADWNAHSTSSFTYTSSLSSEQTSTVPTVQVTSFIDKNSVQEPANALVSLTASFSQKIGAVSAVSMPSFACSTFTSTSVSMTPSSPASQEIRSFVHHSHNQGQLSGKKPTDDTISQNARMCNVDNMRDLAKQGESSDDEDAEDTDCVASIHDYSMPQGPSTHIPTSTATIATTTTIFSSISALGQTLHATSEPSQSTPIAQSSIHSLAISIPLGTFCGAIQDDRETKSLFPMRQMAGSRRVNVSTVRPAPQATPPTQPTPAPRSTGFSFNSPWSIQPQPRRIAGSSKVYSNLMTRHVFNPADVSSSSGPLAYFTSGSDTPNATTAPAAPQLSLTPSSPHPTSVLNFNDVIPYPSTRPCPAPNLWEAPANFSTNTPFPQTSVSSYSSLANALGPSTSAISPPTSSSVPAEFTRNGNSFKGDILSPTPSASSSKKVPTGLGFKTSKKATTTEEEEDLEAAKLIMEMKTGRRRFEVDELSEASLFLKPTSPIVVTKTNIAEPQACPPRLTPAPSSSASTCSSSTSSSPRPRPLSHSRPSELKVDVKGNGKIKATDIPIHVTMARPLPPSAPCPTPPSRMNPVAAPSHHYPSNVDELWQGNGTRVMMDPAMGLAHEGSSSSRRGRRPTAELRPASPSFCQLSSVTINDDDKEMTGSQCSGIDFRYLQPSRSTYQIEGKTSQVSSSVTSPSSLVAIATKDEEMKDIEPSLQSPSHLRSTVHQGHLAVTANVTNQMEKDPQILKPPSPPSLSSVAVVSSTTNTKDGEMKQAIYDERFVEVPRRSFSSNRKSQGLSRPIQKSQPMRACLLKKKAVREHGSPPNSDRVEVDTAIPVPTASSTRRDVGRGGVDALAVSEVAPSPPTNSSGSEGESGQDMIINQAADSLTKAQEIAVPSSRQVDQEDLELAKAKDKGRWWWRAEAEAHPQLDTCPVRQEDGNGDEPLKENTTSDDQAMWARLVASVESWTGPEMSDGFEVSMRAPIGRERGVSIFGWPVMSLLSMPPSLPASQPVANHLPNSDVIAEPPSGSEVTDPAGYSASSSLLPQTTLSAAPVASGAEESAVGGSPSLSSLGATSPVASLSGQLNIHQPGLQGLGIVLTPASLSQFTPFTPAYYVNTGLAAVHTVLTMQDEDSEMSDPEDEWGMDVDEPYDMDTSEDFTRGPAPLCPYADVSKRRDFYHHPDETYTNTTIVPFGCQYLASYPSSNNHLRNIHNIQAY